MTQKEEPKTLEEAAEFNFEKQVSNPYSTGTAVYTAYEKGFELGAKWQAERMYSEEEVLELIRKSHFVEQNIEEWFEQHKKK
jgi:hypothetical protein